MHIVRGNGRIFYFRPGHETYPTYYLPEVQRVIVNAVHWARPTVRIPDACRFLLRLSSSRKTQKRTCVQPLATGNPESFLS